MPHPKGIVRVNFVRRADTLEYVVDVPAGLPAIFRAQGKETTLHAGENTVTVPAR